MGYSARLEFVWLVIRLYSRLVRLDWWERERERQDGGIQDKGLWLDNLSAKDIGDQLF